MLVSKDTVMLHRYRPELGLIYLLHLDTVQLVALSNCLQTLGGKYGKRLRVRIELPLTEELSVSSASM